LPDFPPEVNQDGPFVQPPIPSGIDDNAVLPGYRVLTPRRMNFMMYHLTYPFGLFRSQIRNQMMNRGLAQRTTRITQSTGTLMRQSLITSIFARLTKLQQGNFVSNPLWFFHRL
jgi:hypothetical protein